MANLVPTQVEQLQRIGAHLRQVRQEQGLSLDVLANQIFIRPALLQALETGREEQLPEAVFIQGFIRRYAEALGLDGKAISQEFVVSPPPMVPNPDLVTPAGSTPAGSNSLAAPAPVAQPAPAPVAKSTPEPAPTPATEAAKATATTQPTPPSPTFSTGQPTSTVQNAPLANPFPQAVTMAEEQRGGFPLWLALVAAVVVVGGGLGLWLGRGSSPETATQPVEEPTAVKPPLNAEEPVAAEPEPEPEPEPAALEAPIVVAVSLSERSWLSVVADGRTVYEGTSDSGYEGTWTAQNSLVFTTGNAGGVSLSFNGEDPVVLGNSGAVRTLRLTPDSQPAELSTP